MKTIMQNNTVRHNYQIKQADRNRMTGNSSFVVWFTGLSGSGKSTLANKLEEQLFAQGIHSYVLDGDNIRQGINRDLNFTEEDRTENLRRIAEIAKLFVDAGIVTIAAFIAPLAAEREKIRSIVGADNFVEIYVSTPIEECEKRDVKGLYKRARLGEIPNFTGISSPYEAPKHPDLEIETSKIEVEEAIASILNVIEEKLKLNE